MMPVGKIVSGGQTGVDRAALDFARSAGISCGGWVPRGGLAEDMPDPPGLLAIYPELRETGSRSYPPRTRLNIVDSDATLILKPARTRSRGTSLTVALARKERKPLLVIDPGDPGAADRVLEFVAQLPQNPVLNIAGPRESSAPGIYELSLGLLEKIAEQSRE